MTARASAASLTPPRTPASSNRGPPFLPLARGPPAAGQPYPGDEPPPHRLPGAGGETPQHRHCSAPGSYPPTLDTIPGFGPLFSARIIAEFGGVERFDYDQARVPRLTSLKWRKHQSAEFEARETRLARTGNRYYFCEAANAVQMRAPEYTAYYERKYHEVRRHQHKRAIVLTAHKLDKSPHHFPL